MFFKTVKPQELSGSYNICNLAEGRQSGISSPPGSSYKVYFETSLSISI